MSRALPPVGWHRTVVQPWQMTTVCACEKTVVMVKQPGHLTSMKKERGAGTSVCGRHQRLVSLMVLFYVFLGVGVVSWRRTLSLCLRASEAGAGLRRSTARTCHPLAIISHLELLPVPSCIPIPHPHPPSTEPSNIAGGPNHEPPPTVPITNKASTAHEE